MQRDKHVGIVIRSDSRCTTAGGRFSALSCYTCCSSPRRENPTDRGLSMVHRPPLTSTVSDLQYEESPVHAQCYVSFLAPSCKGITVSVPAGADGVAPLIPSSSISVMNKDSKSVGLNFSFL